MKILEEGKYIIEDDEETKFIETQDRFNELCKSIKFKKQTLQLLQHKADRLCKETRKVREQLEELQEEEKEIEAYLVSKHKKTFIVARRIDRLINKLSEMTDTNKMNYLLNNKNAYELFTSIDFERFIQPKERGIENE
jgi:hypothetical protein